jgi:hypothetical protein
MHILLSSWWLPLCPVTSDPRYSCDTKIALSDLTTLVQKPSEFVYKSRASRLGVVATKKV